ncbi:deoxyribonuclease-1-like [Symphorus nematophorus]
MRLLCALGLFLAALHLCTPLLLGAFNIKSFGDKKASNATVMNIIRTIVQRYDIILIQEVRDSDLSATTKLMAYVNRGSPPQSMYDYTVSEPLGNSTYKERYLFLYRVQMVSVSGDYQNTNTLNFSRPPFIVRFSSTQAGVNDFVLIPQHTTPSSAVKQLDALYNVVTVVPNLWNTSDIVLLGDFNAGCSYVSGSDWQQIRLFTDKSFHWLISDQVDTTVSRSNCPYDRIVVTTSMNVRVVQGSAQVYNYETALGLTQQEAKAVSDHFPVEVRLQ